MMIFCIKCGYYLPEQMCYYVNSISVISLTDVKLCFFKAVFLCLYSMANPTWQLYNVTVMQMFEAAYVNCVKMFVGYARLDNVTSMFFIWVFLQLVLSFTMPGVDLLPAFRVIITQLLDLFVLFVLFNV